MRLFFTVSLLLLSGMLFAQSAVTLSSEIDERLYETYDEAYLLTLQKSHPVLLQRLNYYLDNAWYITEYPKEKAAVDLPTVSITDTQNVNIFLLEREQQLQRDPNKQMIYQIENSDKVLVYHSTKRFNDNFNQLRLK